MSWENIEIALLINRFPPTRIISSKKKRYFIVRDGEDSFMNDHIKMQKCSSEASSHVFSSKDLKLN